MPQSYFKPAFRPYINYNFMSKIKIYTGMYIVSFKFMTKLL